MFYFLAYEEVQECFLVYACPIAERDYQLALYKYLEYPSGGSEKRGKEIILEALAWPIEEANSLPLGWFNDYDKIFKLEDPSPMGMLWKH